MRLLALAVDGVSRSPACWPASEFDRQGIPMFSDHVAPDHAVFDVWIETPGTGWYDMCQEAGYDGYDGIHPAFAIELDTCWLSWDESPNSLAARLRSDEP